MLEGVDIYIFGPDTPSGFDLTATRHEEQIPLPSVQTNAVREFTCIIYYNSYAGGGLSGIGNYKIYDGERLLAMGNLADGFPGRLSFGINGSTKAPSPTSVPVEAPTKALYFSK